MKVRIGKEFTWEMSHRLTFHQGECINIHGHSYKMLIQLEGETNENLMLIDFYDIEAIVSPLLKQIDHAFVCDSKDEVMIEFLKNNNFKMYVMEGFSTAENLSNFFAKKLTPEFEKHSNLTDLKVRVYETADAWAEVDVKLS